MSNSKPGSGWLGKEIKAAVEDVSQWPSGMRRENELAAQLNSDIFEAEVSEENCDKHNVRPD